MQFGVSTAVAGVLFLLIGGLYALTVPLWGYLADKKVGSIWITNEDVDLCNTSVLWGFTLKGRTIAKALQLTYKPYSRLFCVLTSE